MVTKAELRKHIKQVSAQREIDSARVESSVIMARVEQCTEFRAARVVALYWSLPDEVFTHNFIEKWATEKAILLPAVEGCTMHLKRYSAHEPMRIGAFNICEPTVAQKSAQEVALEAFEPDLIIVPGVAFDHTGHRLGRGKGFYDKFLQSRNIPRIGVCFADQLFETIPFEEHDVVMTKIISSR